MPVTPKELSAARAAYPVLQEMLPDPIVDRKYELRFASTPDDLERIQKLRFEVFNVELGEGLEESFATGRDEDRFDPVCHHMMVVENASGAVIGTYRMQTWEMAERYGGFYSADEFDLGGLPGEVIGGTVELGRACITKDHRNRKVLFLLWKGLANYMVHNRKRFLFGCCSLTSQDPAEGKRVMDHLEREGFVTRDYPVVPQPDWVCYGDDQTYDPAVAAKVPKLFRLYLRYGAKVCGPPAIDRFFKTIDYFVIWDLKTMDRDLYRLYFES
jgi:putative hemolysin